MERLAGLARELDQRLVSLDGTVNVVFEALQRNINTYHESLSQALARMHSQGMQGEQLMASFLNNLTQYLQRQSPVLQPSLPGGSKSNTTHHCHCLTQYSVQLANSSAEVEPLRVEKLIQLDNVFYHSAIPRTEDLRCSAVAAWYR